MRTQFFARDFAVAVQVDAVECAQQRILLRGAVELDGARDELFIGDYAAAIQVYLRDLRGAEPDPRGAVRCFHEALLQLLHGDDAIAVFVESLEDGAEALYFLGVELLCNVEQRHLAKSSRLSKPLEARLKLRAERLRWSLVAEHPGVVEELERHRSLPGVLLQHAHHQAFARVGNFRPRVLAELVLLEDLWVKLLDGIVDGSVIWAVEGGAPTQDDIREDAERPDV